MTTDTTARVSGTISPYLKARYFPRSASDRTDDWPFWFVADRQRGDTNITADLIRLHINPKHCGGVFTSKEDARELARLANEATT